MFKLTIISIKIPLSNGFIYEFFSIIISIFCGYYINKIFHKRNSFFKGSYYLNFYIFIINGFINILPHIINLLSKY
jgi:hypothetical protein